MKSMKRWLAMLLAVLLMMHSIPSYAEETNAEESITIEEGMGGTDTSEEREGEDKDGTAPFEDEEEVDEDGTTLSEDEEEVDEDGTAPSEDEEEVYENETVHFEDEEGEDVDEEITVTDEVIFNTGNWEKSIVNRDAYEAGIGFGCFEEDGSYTIELEDNAFFPYEVQFIYDRNVINTWFKSPSDIFEIAGHRFYVSSKFDNTAVTQMTLKVAGNKVIVYPEKKEFTNNNGVSPVSLLPLEEKYLTANLSDYTPIELTMMSVDSIFTGENQVKDTDKVVWKPLYYDGVDYNISESGSMLDLSYSSSWEMIVGAADQLEKNNIRYIINLNRTSTSKWIVPTIYIQDADGSRTEIVDLDTSYYNSKENKELYIRDTTGTIKYDTEAYISLNISSSYFPQPRFASIKVYEGNFKTAEEAKNNGTDITNQIYNVDLTQKDAGYQIKRYDNKWITMVTYDNSGNVTGCLPFYIYLYSSSSSSSSSGSLSLYSMFRKTGDGVEDVSYTSSYNVIDGCTHRVMTLYKEYPANGTYYQRMDYNNGKVEAAYVGQYSTIKEAVSADAEDIKEKLFDKGGYGADYSKGVYFTIFATDDDGTERVYYYCIKTEAGEMSKLNQSGATSVNFYGLRNKDKIINSYVTKYDDDSYGENNYITILVGSDEDITNLAPLFSLGNGIRLYTAGSSTVEVSGESYHDFSKGAVQYSAAAENGTNLKNYWLQVVKAKSGTYLYVNSLSDENAETRVDNGVTYSKREVMLDSYHDYHHDILLVNMGTDDIKSIKAELQSDVIELDDYWTLSGNYNLSGFDSLVNNTNYGELSNFAKIRIKSKKEGLNGETISGTLLIKSGNTTLMELTLTGTIGDPCITTEKLPEDLPVVKYVPYGTIIQNNNKYSWNKVSYSLLSGSLPVGMEIRPNGELYGVPTEAGEFTFTVSMTNSYSSFSASQKTYTLKVMDNTDANVNAATDEGYILSQRIQNISSSNLSGSQTLVSEGVFDEFVDLYLDGNKLERGVDYDAESGSTRITIQNQVLNKGSGTHTIGIEFRVDGDEEKGELKRAAQNYTIGNSQSSDNNNNSSNNGNSSNDNNGSNNGNSSNDNNGSNNDYSSDANSSSTNNSEINADLGSTRVTQPNNINTPSSSTNTNFTEHIENIDWDIVVKRIIAAQMLSEQNAYVLAGTSYTVPAFITCILAGKSTALMIQSDSWLALSISGLDIGSDYSEFNMNFIFDNVIPADVSRQVTERAILSYAISTAEKELFPFKVDLHVNLGAENARKTAKLYYYDEISGTMKLEGSFKITETGQAMFAINRGDEYIVVVERQVPENHDEQPINSRYIVVPGDTLSGIARKNRIRLKDLLQANPHITNPDIIYPNQVIFLPQNS